LRVVANADGVESGVEAVEIAVVDRDADDDLLVVDDGNDCHRTGGQVAVEVVSDAVAEAAGTGNRWSGDFLVVDYHAAIVAESSQQIKILQLEVHMKRAKARRLRPAAVDFGTERPHVVDDADHHAV